MELVLFINMLMYLLTATYTWRKYKVNAYSFLWIYYAVFAIMGFAIVVMGIYDDRFYLMRYNTHFSLLPYVFNYICVFLILLPFRFLKVDSSLGNKSAKCKRNINRIFLLVGVLLFCNLILKLVAMQEYSKYSLLERRVLAISGNFLMSKENNILYWYLDLLLSMFQEAILPYVIIASIVYYNKKIVNNVKMTILLFLCISPPFLLYLMTSNRAGLFFLALNLTFFYFLFYETMSKQLRKVILRMAVVIAVPITVLLALITVVRYEDNKTDTSTGVLSYFGEAFPNLNAFVYDQADHFTYGMRLFPDYIKMVTGYALTTDGGLEGYHKFWTDYTGVEILVFKTLFGDLYIEFGTIGAIAFIGLISFMTILYVKKSKNPFCCYALLSVLYGVCINGVLDFGLKYGSFYIIRVIFLIFVFGFFWRIYTGEGNSISYKKHKQK